MFYSLPSDYKSQQVETPIFESLQVQVELFQWARPTHKWHISMLVEDWATQMCCTIWMSWNFGKTRKVDTSGKDDTLLFIHKICSINFQTSTAWPRSSQLGRKTHCFPGSWTFRLLANQCSCNGWDKSCWFEFCATNPIASSSCLCKGCVQCQRWIARGRYCGCNQSWTEHALSERNHDWREIESLFPACTYDLRAKR